MSDLQKTMHCQNGQLQAVTRVANLLLNFQGLSEDDKAVIRAGIGHGEKPPRLRS